MNKKLLLLAVTALAGCTIPESPKYIYHYDKCAEARYMQACLSAAKGPTLTKYNDWDEAIDSCSQSSKKIAERSDPTAIEPSCLLTEVVQYRQR